MSFKRERFNLKCLHYKDNDFILIIRIICLDLKKKDMELITFKTLEISIASKLQAILVLNGLNFEIETFFSAKGHAYVFFIEGDKKFNKYMELIELIKMENK